MRAAPQPRSPACLGRLGWLAGILALGAAGCLDPQDRRPGLWLSGEVAAQHPEDWSFADRHREVAIEVSTPYWIPHSVTIWCAAAGGELYVGARNPEEKRWPGWVEDDPEVRLEIGDTLYEARLERVEDPRRLAAVRSAYAAKYDLPDPPPPDAPPARYWRVVPRR